MDKDIEEYVKSCPCCLHFKSTPERSELNPILVKRPLELVHMDFLMVESGNSDKEVNILIATDYFMRYAQVYSTKSQTASVVANTLWECFFGHYGFPEENYVRSSAGILKAD